MEEESKRAKLPAEEESHAPPPPPPPSVVVKEEEENVIREGEYLILYGGPDAIITCVAGPGKLIGTK